MVRKTIISALIGVGVLLAPLAADAVGLGKLTVTSGLGQPFRGEIELLAVDRTEEGSLSAHLATPDTFRDAKVERTAALLSLRFSIEQKKSGEWFIKLTSPQPINDPFLDMLVEINWPAGRLLREYTVLLDPPGVMAAQQPVAPTEAPSGRTTSTDMTKAALPAPRAEKKPPASQSAIPPAAKVEAKAAMEGGSDTYGPVKAGQNLSTIAEEVKPEGVSLEQMLVSLYRANQQAFSGNNMNRLKTGQILRLPEGDQVAALDQGEAVKEIRAHAADWHAYRQKLAGAVETAKPVHDDQARQMATGKITSAVEDHALGANESDKDVLKLSKSESIGGKAGKAVATEDAIARDKALQDANQHIAEMEKNIQDMQRLLEIRNQSMAELQKQGNMPPAPQQPVAVEEKKAETKPLAEPSPVSAPASGVQPAQTTEQKASEPPKPKRKVVTLQSKPSAPQPSFLHELLSNPLVLAGGALVVLLGGVFGARRILARRKLGKAEKGAKGRAADKALPLGDMPQETLPEVSSALTDFTQSGLGVIDTNEVDPIAEAEVYMAYGRDVQAEEILREAMARDPQRHEIHLKLLEIYAGRKDRGSYEELARQLYAATGGSPDPDWDKAAEMGRMLDAGNPLYGATEMPVAMEQEQPASMEEPMGEPIDLGEAQEAVDASPDLDFNLDAASESAEDKMDIALESASSESPAPADEHIEELVPDLDFDLGSDAEAPQAEEIASAPETPPADENLLDFNLDISGPAETQPEAAPVVEEEPAQAPVVEEEEPAPAVAESPAETVEDEFILNFDLELPDMPAEAEKVAEAESDKVVETLEIPAEKEGLGSAEAALDLPVSEPSEPVAIPVPEETPAVEVETSFDETMLLDLSASAAEEPAAPEAPLVAEPESLAPKPEDIELTPPAMSDEAMLDFDFDIGEETPPATAPSLDLSGIDLDLAATPTSSDDAAAKLKQEDAVRFQDAATKMDLAKAYMEMGDKEGASEILQEVMQEGSDEQREDAKKLLNEIG